MPIPCLRVVYFDAVDVVCEGALFRTRKLEKTTDAPRPKLDSGEDMVSAADQPFGADHTANTECLEVRMELVHDDVCDFCRECRSCTGFVSLHGCCGLPGVDGKVRGRLGDESGGILSGFGVFRDWPHDKEILPASSRTWDH